MSVTDAEVLAHLRRYPSGLSVYEIARAIGPVYTGASTTTVLADTATVRKALGRLAAAGLAVSEQVPFHCRGGRKTIWRPG